MVVDAQRRRFHEQLEERFGYRSKAHPNCGREADGPLNAVSPASVEEVEYLVELSNRYSVPLVPEGAGTAPKPRRSPSSISVRFDLMREASVPQPPEYLVEVQSGLPWLHLEDHLQRYGRSLPVYPTSASKATIGGWLALNGLGVGSFEYGRLWENVGSVDVVFFDGRLRTVPGSMLPAFLKPGNPKGLIVSATLRTRRLEGDTSFGAAFDTPENMAQAVQEIYQSSIPLWHLGLQNDVMTRARGHGGGYLLFGAYPEERSPKVRERLWTEIEAHGGRRMSLAETYWVWGTRFYPVGSSQEMTTPRGILLPVGHQLAPTLRRFEHPQGTVAIQGSVSRSGEIVLLALDEGYARDNVT